MRAKGNRRLCIRALCIRVAQPGTRLCSVHRLTTTRTMTRVLAAKSNRKLPGLHLSASGNGNPPPHLEAVPRSMRVPAETARGAGCTQKRRLCTERKGA
jgi:hypothetical protein